jgi:hypothetical protein
MTFSWSIVFQVWGSGSGAGCGTWPALAAPGADRGGGDDRESHEGGGAEEPEVESEGERLAEGVVADDEVVGPAGRDGGQDGEAERSADLLGCVEQA